MIRKIIFGSLVILFALIIWNWSLLVYGINQGIGQLNIVWRAKPVEEIMSDPMFPDSLKAKLNLIDEVRSKWQFFRDRRPETYGKITEL